MSKLTIWNELKRKGFSDTAAAAIMGNMEAESNCISFRVQGDFSKDYRYSQEYTGHVDAGNIDQHEFVYDGPGGGGYGLCQWTNHARKAGLYYLAFNDWQCSIGDEALQIEWLYKELQQPEFKQVLDTLKSSTSLKTCSDIFCKQYEKPADQSEAALRKRAEYGSEIFQEFSGTEAEDPEDSGKIEITEEQLKTFSKAMLIVKTFQDLLKLVEDF
jgi:hypothetical protein